MTKVKICGNKSSRDLEIAFKYGADAVGFIVEVPVPTPRKISREKARELIKQVPVFINTVLVIMPDNAKEGIEIINATNPDIVQIHNNLPISELEIIKDSVSVKIIKTIPISDTLPLDYIKKNAKVADAILLDTSVGGRSGGTGITHDWNLSAEIVQKFKLPIILAGGLNPNNVENAIKVVKPYAVDTASGVETKGVKDEVKVKEFINKAKCTDIN
ncbi:MAG TPA: phosphoribosylanthranilate isomerase [Methanosarcinales archaeon]|nr:phosphoribosylanthranilate isomerase [Methanosarcinales archaeon]